jgi:hypothetical protein
VKTPRELSWAQVRSWRLARHHLDGRAPARQLLAAVKEIGGVQAQVLSAAGLAIWNRVDGVERATVDAALWKKKTLVKIWAMRGTLHLLPADEMPMWCAANSTRQLYWHPAWLKYHGVGAAELQAIIDAVPQALDGKQLTREQLAGEIVRITKRPHLAELLRLGWGALLKPSALAGHICFGPSQGTNVTFVRTDQWLGRWKTVDPAEAVPEVARRYLHAYGPARREELAGWWGVKAPQGRAMLASLGDEIEQVDVEGWRGFMLARDVARVMEQPEADSVRLLGNFDPLVVLGRKYAGYALKPAHRTQVHRTAGWVSPVLLVNGVVSGVWALDTSGRKLEVKLFSPLGKGIKDRVAAEAANLGEYLGRKLQVHFAR